MEEISTRRKIYEAILLNPGLHFRELQKRLDMPTGMLEYHLQVLEREELVVAKMDGKYKRFFANTTMTREERKIMGALRSDISRKIVIYLLEHGKSRHSELAAAINITKSALTYHVRALIKKEIVQRIRMGREVYYSVINPEMVASTLIKYRKSFLDVLVDNFASWYVSEGKKIK